MPKLTLNENLRFIWYDLMSDRARRLAKQSIAFAVLGSLFLIAAPYGISLFIDGVSQGEYTIIVQGFAAFAGIKVIEIGIGFGRQQHREYFFQEAFWYLPQAITSLSFARPLAWLASASSDIDGGGIESLRDKVWNVVGTFTFSIIPIASQAVFGIAACVWVHPLIGLVALSYTVIELKLGHINNRFIQTEMEPVIDMFKRWDRRMAEWWKNLEHVKSQGVETKILGYIHDEVQPALSEDDRVWRIYYSYWIAIRRFVSLTFSFGLYGLTVYFVFTDVIVGSAGILAIFSMQRISNTLAELSDQQREVQFNLASIAKYRRVLKKPVPFVYNEGKTFDEPDISITFDNVSHVVGGNEKHELILRDVNLHIAAGERVGIVGLSGAGKSQLMSLLVQADDPVSGTVRISGTDIRDWNLETLLRYYGVIMQKSEPYEDTILGNALFGVSHLDLPTAFGDLSRFEQTALLGKAHAALKKAGLAADEFDEGILTNIGYKGTKLSGGQQQRLQIAGAHLKLSMSDKRPRFLLADEPTASLDSMSEVTVMEHLDSLPPNTTMCMVAHRLSTVENMDKIVMVRPLGECDPGIEQVTTHDSLYELYQSDPLFRQMADHQKYQPEPKRQVA